MGKRGDGPSLSTVGTQGVAASSGCSLHSQHARRWRAANICCTRGGAVHTKIDSIPRDRPRKMLPGTSYILKVGGVGKVLSGTSCILKDGWLKLTVLLAPRPLARGAAARGA